ncbi:hypothetical protein CK203_069725 [Vitis vinifera]|uniref:Uncharacterized protein n=1 Tax=Vitis vinifera TaxID=29760 RepID=A0A438E0A0_VITVI|nr:hypothetical protein CK203_069725 [Vitis vinifera]
MGLISGILMGTIFGIALMAGWVHMMRYRSIKRVAKEVLEKQTEAKDFILVLDGAILAYQAVDIKLLGSLNREDLKKICGDNFPEWISFPVYEQIPDNAVLWYFCINICLLCVALVKWLNKQLTKLWPFVADVAKAFKRYSQHLCYAFKRNPYNMGYVEQSLSNFECCGTMKKDNQLIYTLVRAKSFVRP